MGARTADWHLLNYDSDPVPKSGEDIDPVLEHYNAVSSALAAQAVLMRKLGEGDETLLKGESADALRERAKDSADTLEKASARYENLEIALDDYRGALETARSGSWNAVIKAQEAVNKQQRAEQSPDPANAPREDGAPEPTPDDIEDSALRTNAIESAGQALSDAVEAMRAVQAAFDEAANRASARIRKNWDTDNLSTSSTDAFVYGLNKFLKGLVEVLGYIGLALAVIGMIFTGVGFFLWAGLAIAVVSFIGSVALAAQGESGWLNVILGAVGLFTFGLGLVVANAARIGQTALVQGARSFTSGTVDRLQRSLNNITRYNGLTGPGRVVVRTNSVPLVTRPPRVVLPPRSNTTPAGGNSVRPPTPTGGTTVPPVPVRINSVDAARLDRIDSFVATPPPGPSPWSGSFMDSIRALRDFRANLNWGSATGVDDAVAYAAVNARFTSLFGEAAKSTPLWMYFGGVANGYGIASGIFGAAHAPSDIADMTGGDDPRTEWGITDALYADLMSPTHAFDR